MEQIICNRCELHPGDTVDGRYSVVKMLGAGTFGCVYRVKDRTGQDYALKVLKLWEVPSQERGRLLKRFDMEYETGRIKSNYLVRSHEKGCVDGNPYIVMDFCPGGDLMSAAEHGNVDFIKAGKEVLYGLRDLHNNGKVHRDLKPENVLMRSDGTAILTDFGISGDQKNRQTQTDIFGRPKEIFGTYAYMPPEQINPKKNSLTVLPTVDVFAFGVMMYQLITYELPFGDLQTEADLPRYTMRITQNKWNRSLLENAHGGAQWMSVMEGCLRPRQQDRLQDVDHVLKLMPQSDSRGYQPAESDSIRGRNVVVNGVLLRVMQGEEYNKVYRLEELLHDNIRLLTVGRESPDVYNAIQIRETMSTYISRCHCTLECDVDSHQWTVRDGQWRDRMWKTSTNGTYVNATEVGSNGYRLSLGDIITIGDVKMRVEGY